MPIYFVEGQSSKLIKIGFTEGINQRMIQLRSEVQENLRLLFIRDDLGRSHEILFHKRLDKYRTMNPFYKKRLYSSRTNREWIREGDEVTGLMNRLSTRDSPELENLLRNITDLGRIYRETKEKLLHNIPLLGPPAKEYKFIASKPLEDALEETVREFGSSVGWTMLEETK
jgi:hypothetical protein